jgi:hypothetical protein
MQLCSPEAALDAMIPITIEHKAMYGSIDTSNPIGSATTVFRHEIKNAIDQAGIRVGLNHRQQVINSYGKAATLTYTFGYLQRCRHDTEILINSL